MPSLGKVEIKSCWHVGIGETPVEGVTYSLIGSTYMAKFPESDSFKGWSIAAMGALGLGKMMTASESSALVSEVKTNGSVSLVYTWETCVEGTVYAKSTDVMFTGTNACLIAVIHVGAYDESWKSHVRLLDVR